MIAFIEGPYVQLEPAKVIINVNGIGYEVFISLQTYAEIKETKKGKLFTYFHVKEDAQLLYGFFTEEEKQVFTLLISISGIGPNTALVVLSSLSPAELQNAILTENVKVIQSVKGIGAKTAQRVILELKDKIQKIIQLPEQENIPEISAVPNNKLKDDALAALTTLGIAKATAEKSIIQLLKKTNGDISLEELIRMALKAR